MATRNVATRNIETSKIKNDFWLNAKDLAKILNKDLSVVISEIEKSFGPLRMKSILPPEIVRRYLSKKNFRFPEKVVSFQMLKGGVAKTTSALNFGLRAAQYGTRVLFIDLDQQANLTYAFGVDAEELPVWVDVCEKKNSIQECLIKVDKGIDLVPSSLNNSILDRVLLNGNRNWAQAVKGPLKEIRYHYDLVIIDTAPNLSAVNTAVTCASDIVVLPVNPDKFSMLGVKKNIADLNDLKTEFNLKFKKKILFTKFDGRELASREILSQCIDLFEEMLLKNYIRTSTEIKNSIRSSKSLFSAKSNAKEDYDLVTRELLGWE